MLTPPTRRLATLRFEPSTYRVVAPGTHVICAVTGEEIPLSRLCYWNAERQEAYADAVAAARRLVVEGGRP